MWLRLINPTDAVNLKQVQAMLSAAAAAPGAASLNAPDSSAAALIAAFEGTAEADRTTAEADRRDAVGRGTAGEGQTSIEGT